MKTLLLLLLLPPSVAFAQPADRDFTLTIPGNRLARVQAVCERERIGMEPEQETLTLRACMRRILFQEIRQRNSSMVRKEAISGTSSEIGAFNADMADE